MTGPLDLLLRECRLPDGVVADIGCHGGRIVAIGQLAGRSAARTISCEGRAVTPGQVDAHIHLDKAPCSPSGHRAGRARWPRPYG